MCFVRAWNLLLLDNCIAPWLSALSKVGSKVDFLLILAQKFRIHKISFVALVCPTYSASVDERVTMFCFFELQLIAPAPKIKQYPKIEW